MEGAKEKLSEIMLNGTTCIEEEEGKVDDSSERDDGEEMADAKEAFKELEDAQEKVSDATDKVKEIMLNETTSNEEEEGKEDDSGERDDGKWMQDPRYEVFSDLDIEKICSKL